MDENLNSFVSVEADVTLDLLSKAVVDPEFGDKVNIEEGIQDASHQMDVGTAARLMEKKHSHKTFLTWWPKSRQTHLESSLRHHWPRRAAY